MFTIAQADLGHLLDLSYGGGPQCPGCVTSLEIYVLKFADDSKLFRKTKEIGDKQNLQDDIDQLVWKVADVIQFWEM